MKPNFTVSDLELQIELGNVKYQVHASAPYTIYNYTDKVHLDRLWGPVTTQTRGLILDDEYNVIARPFEKFWNYTDKVPDDVVFGKPGIVTDKLDGAMGIIYPMPNGTHRVATRGSFYSQQAKWATKWLEDRAMAVPPGLTPIVEIICHHNNNIVDYGSYEDVVLLAVLDNETGADIPMWEVDWWSGNKVKQFYHLSQIDDAYHYANEYLYDHLEGLVVQWPRYKKPSFRLKVKNANYVKIAKEIVETRYER